nr:MAG TPA: hypothetical protein [Caudoviricetes sp.]
MEKNEMMNKLIENLGVEKTLEELVDALSDDEMKSDFEFICRMNDIPMDEEEEEDDDYNDDIDWDETKKITLEEFFSSKKELAIHCKTKKEANKLCKAFDKMGRIWRGNHKSYLEDNYWQNYKKDTCYTNNGMYGHKEACLNINYKVYEFNDVKFEG